MPHVPARGIESRDELDRRLGLYADAGAREALAIAGGIDRPRGPFADTMAMLETGLFDARGFTRIHVAGHPEGNRDIDPVGGEAVVMAALRAKADFARKHRRRDGDRHPVRLRGRPDHRLDRPAARERDRPAGAYRRRRARRSSRP